jgi:DNA repair protein RecO
MYHSYHTDGFVLSGRARGAGSRLANVYTRDLGLVSAIAQSAREERSKLRAHLTDFSHGTYTLVRGKEGWRLTGADNVENAYFALRGSPKAQRLLARLFSLVRRLVHGEDRDAYLFSTLATAVALAQTHATDEAILGNLEIISVLRILASLGYVGENAPLRSFIDAETVSLALCTSIPAVRADALAVINKAFSAAQL